MATGLKPPRRKPSEFLVCRALRGHALDPMVDTASDATLVLLCGRCSTVRRDWLNRFGELEGRSYEYPEGYKLARGDERPPLADLRLQLVRELSNGKRH